MVLIHCPSCPAGALRPKLSDKRTGRPPPRDSNPHRRTLSSQSLPQEPRARSCTPLAPATAVAAASVLRGNPLSHPPVSQRIRLQRDFARALLVRPARAAPSGFQAHSRETTVIFYRPSFHFSRVHATRNPLRSALRWELDPASATLPPPPTFSRVPDPQTS